MVVVSPGLFIGSGLAIPSITAGSCPLDPTESHWAELRHAFQPALSWYQARVLCQRIGIPLGGRGLFRQPPLFPDKFVVSLGQFDLEVRVTLEVPFV